jgi:uncharacterized membrane protein
MVSVVKRPLEALLHVVLLVLIVVPVAAFVLGLLAATSTVSVGLFSGGGLSRALGASLGRGYGGYDGGYGYGDSGLPALMGSLQGAGAASASVAIVMVVVIALFALVGMLGYIMIHDSLGAGIEASAADRLRQGVSQVKRKLEEHRPVPATNDPAVATAGPNGSQAGLSCAGCGAHRVAGDRFCGECGTPS